MCPSGSDLRSYRLIAFLCCVIRVWICFEVVVVCLCVLSLRVGLCAMLILNGVVLRSFQMCCLCKVKLLSCFVVQVLLQIC